MSPLYANQQIPTKKYYADLILIFSYFFYHFLNHKRKEVKKYVARFLGDCLEYISRQITTNQKQTNNKQKNLKERT